MKSISKGSISLTISRPPMEDFSKPILQRKKAMKILIIDDNPDIRNLIKIISKPYDFDVLMAESGPAGFDILENQRVDLVVLDILMPEIDGFAVCKKIKSNPDTSEIPVIFLSTKDETESLVKGLKLGAVDYISKPFHSDEFIARIKIHLELYKSKKHLQEKLQENKQLIHILSHDLKNPVGCAQSFVEMIETYPEDTEEYVEYVKMALDQGLQIIGSVQDLMSIKEGKAKLKLNHLNLGSLVGRSLNILQNKITEKNITVTVGVDPDIFVKVDEVSFINSVLNNLMTNAVKFSFQDSKIEIKAEQTGDLVTLSVTDHGIGMPEEIENNIFNINKSISRRGTDGEMGTGFGMPLVKTFVEAYGGTIKIISREKNEQNRDHGTKAVITLSTL